MVFFFVLFFHSIFCLVQALGLSSYACGWAYAISVFRYASAAVVTAHTPSDERE